MKKEPRVMAQEEKSPQFQAGAATSNITPPLGKPIIGSFSPFPSKHVHDELLVRCLVLDDGQVQLALVVCDLLGIHRVVSDEARRLIQERLAIPTERVLICTTHTHSASSALGVDRFTDAPEPDDYQRFVATRIADAVQSATNNLRPAQLAFATAEAPEHLSNRRWSLKEGTMPPNPFGGIDKVKMNPGAGSPNLLEPAGPTDPTISILALREPDGKPIAVLSSYSLHYVGGVGPGHISADYYGMYCRRLERLMQPEPQDPPVVAIMSNGTSGDVNNISFRQPRPRREPYAHMQAVADDVADKVLQAIGTAEYRDSVTLAAQYQELPLTWRQPTAEQIVWARKTVAEPAKEPGKVDLSRFYAKRALRLVDLPAGTSVPLQVFRIGDVCIGTMPCEVFCEIGLEFKERNPLQPAVLVSLSHGYLGYLPTARHLDLGGYETWLGTNLLEPRAAAKMLDALLQMAAEMETG
jgi:neutral ceramidase